MENQLKFTLMLQEIEQQRNWALSRSANLFTELGSKIEELNKEIDSLKETIDHLKTSTEKKKKD